MGFDYRIGYHFISKHYLKKDNSKKKEGEGRELDREVNRKEGEGERKDV